MMIHLFVSYAIVQIKASWNMMKCGFMLCYGFDLHKET